MRLTAITVLSLVALVSAQNTVIMVGIPEGSAGGDDQYSPGSVNVTKGSTVTFKWGVMSTGNHSVTQSSFAAPCTPLSGGFDAGFVFTPAGGATPSPEWNLTITDDSKPIWFFCKQPKGTHCKKGMVGAINAPQSGDNTYAAFQAAAKNSGAPGEDQGGLVGQGASASIFPSPIPSGVTAYVGPTPTNTSPASTAGGASATASKNSVAKYHANSIVALLAAVLGFVHA